MSNLDKYEKAQRKRLVKAIKSIMTSKEHGDQSAQSDHQRETNNRMDFENQRAQTTTRLLAPPSTFSNRRNHRNLSLSMSNNV